jgi:hypothetical protein
MASRRYGKLSSEKVGSAVHQTKRSKLVSGRSDQKITSRKQVGAIGVAQTRRAGSKVPRPPSTKR